MENTENLNEMVNEEIVQDLEADVADTCDDVCEDESKSNLGLVTGALALGIGTIVLVKKGIAKHKAKKALAEADATAEDVEQPKAPKTKWRLRSPFEKVEVESVNTTETVEAKTETEEPKAKKVRKSNKKTEA